MNKCCDRCVEFAQSLENSSIVPSFVKPIVWCSGCNDTHIHPHPDTLAQHPNFPSKLWPDSVKYSNYTEAVADAKFLEFIEDEICSLTRPTCKVQPEGDRRLDQNFLES